MPSRPRVRLRHAVLCDEVRPAAGGKHTLIGVYGADLELHQRPQLIELALMATFEREVGADGVLEIEVSIAGRAAGPHIDLSEAPGDASSINVSAMLAGFFERPGAVSFRYRYGGGRWSERQLWRVAFAADAVELPGERVAELRAQMLQEAS